MIYNAIICESMEWPFIFSFVFGIFSIINKMIQLGVKNLIKKTPISP